MYYLTGDIHGYIKNLENLYKKIQKHLKDDDTLIFSGDYIDRGPSSYEVIEFLINISKRNKTVFIKGNHEDMFLKYKNSQNDLLNYFDNGGITTIKSYRAHGSPEIPPDHLSFYENLILYFETDDFIAVHAGLNPKIYTMEEQQEFDMIWIRDNFFRSPRKWEKTVIFGHTPCSILHGKMKNVYFNEINNIIGIDTGACYGGILTCLRWPDRKIFQG